MAQETVVIWDGAKIRQARMTAEFTAEDAAKLLDITPEYLSMLENGKRQPSPRTLDKLSTLYRQPMSFFLIGEKNCAEA